MIWLGLGLAAMALLLWAVQSFARADARSIRIGVYWLAALGGLALGALLLLTGRGAAALSAVLLLAPLGWSWWREQTGATPGSRTPGSRTLGRMSRAEALSVLGLSDPVSDSDVRAAWVRLMRGVHPDSGGSDWLAARVNQARDVLLGRGRG